MSAVHKALTIAGSDPSGGAGIQADLKTFSRLSVYGMAVIAAMTAQNTLGVSSVAEVAPEFVADSEEVWSGFARFPIHAVTVRAGGPSLIPKKLSAANRLPFVNQSELAIFRRRMFRLRPDRRR